ncbi:MAG: ASCH domain-containing protein [Devosia sp.]
MAALPAQYADLLSFSFGDSPALADELLALVLGGTKTATCAAVRDYAIDNEPIPVVGRRDVVLDGQGRPAAVIETIEVSRRPFRDVPEDFALDEGEGDFDDWRSGHIAYFERNGGWSEDLEIVCERFKLIEVLPR